MKPTGTARQYDAPTGGEYHSAALRHLRKVGLAIATVILSRGAGRKTETITKAGIVFHKLV